MQMFWHSYELCVGWVHLHYQPHLHPPHRGRASDNVWHPCFGSRFCRNNMPAGKTQDGHAEISAERISPCMGFVDHGPDSPRSFFILGTGHTFSSSWAIWLTVKSKSTCFPCTVLPPWALVFWSGCLCLWRPECLLSSLICPLPRSSYQVMGIVICVPCDVRAKYSLLVEMTSCPGSCSFAW